jgi:hypothetical protein
MANWVARIIDRAMILLLYKMGYDNSEIFDTLNTHFPKVRPCEMTIDKITESIDEGTFSYVDSSPPGRRLDQPLIDAVKEEVERNPFQSLRVIAANVGSNKDTVRNILINALGLKKRYSKWVPHSLTDFQKLQRVSSAKRMLTILKQDEVHNFSHIITGDESWILYDYPFTSYWGKPKEKPKEIPKVTIGTPKVMLVVFWGVSATPVLSFLPAGQTMNATIFKKVVVDEVTKYATTLPEKETLFVHWDNARCHSAGLVKSALKETEVKILEQPPCSPDLAPSDFFLFGYLKHQLKGKKTRTLTNCKRT